ncbi:MAG: hypothetical protein JWM19_6661 [Actinomycetia bacterium]|nr:hypothetical protein [Actinomycetes bacterium]
MAVGASGNSLARLAPADLSEGYQVIDSSDGQADTMVKVLAAG